MKTKKLKVKGWDKKAKKVRITHVRTRTFITPGKFLDLKNEAIEYVKEGITTSRPLAKKLRVSHPVAGRVLSEILQDLVK